MSTTPELLDHLEGRASHQLEVESYEHEHDDLQAALVAALGEMTNIPKEGSADAGSYRYSFATLAAALDTIRPVLANHDLALTQPVTTDLEHRTVAITTWILHRGGGRYAAGKITLPLGQTAQATGSVITYARRYAILAAFGITGEDDDDDGRSSASTPPTAPPATAPQRQRMIAQAQMKKIGALMDDAGVNKDDAARRALVASIIRRPIKTRTELTAEEGSTVIGALQSIVDGRATVEITEDGDWRIIATDTGEYR